MSSKCKSPRSEEEQCLPQPGKRVCVEGKKCPTERGPFADPSEEAKKTREAFERFGEKKEQPLEINDVIVAGENVFEYDSNEISVDLNPQAVLDQTESDGLFACLGKHHAKTFATALLKCPSYTKEMKDKYETAADWAQRIALICGMNDEAKQQLVDLAAEYWTSEPLVYKNDEEVQKFKSCLAECKKRAAGGSNHIGPFACPKVEAENVRREFERFCKVSPSEPFKALDVSVALYVLVDMTEDVPVLTLAPDAVDPGTCLTLLEGSDGKCSLFDFFRVNAYGSGSLKRVLKSLFHPEEEPAQEEESARRSYVTRMTSKYKTPLDFAERIALISGSDGDDGGRLIRQLADCISDQDVWPSFEV